MKKEKERKEAMGERETRVMRAWMGEEWKTVFVDQSSSGISLSLISSISFQARLLNNPRK